MKYLLVLLVVLLGAWGWRQSRRLPPSRPGPPGSGTPPPAPPQEMTRCALCAVHLPKAEAVPGRHGLYCCAAHRQQAEPSEV